MEATNTTADAAIESAGSFPIRPFHIDDYEDIIALWDICGLPYKPNGRDHIDKIRHEITQDTAIFLVAEVENRIIGSVLGTHDGRKGWINRLAVHPDFRGSGLAFRLVEEAEQAIYNKGIEIIACLIEDENHASMKFFHKAGYIKHTDLLYFSKRKHSEV